MRLVALVSVVAVRSVATCSNAGDGQTCPSVCSLTRRGSLSRVTRETVKAASGVRRMICGVRRLHERGGPTSRVGNVEHGNSSRNKVSSRISPLPPRRNAEQEVSTPGAVMAASFSASANLGEKQTP
ncbi:MAG: hypothetical protein DWI21_08205 [Planctomycetota bacterium]|nr:MAG: hypothetical protein DWI21_08205 [Planctomycetota bacterium]